ncbi:hypothetical protein ACFDR9_002963, partial [Janthinobacterium sp. CG_23.3]
MNVEDGQQFGSGLGVCAADNSCADHVTRFLPASMAIHFRTRKW